MAVRPLVTASIVVFAVTTAQAGNFNRIASFQTTANIPADEDHTRKTSAEIVAATPDGMTLIYTDGPLGALGLIDIADPSSPAPLGTIDVGGEPTSVVIIGGTAFVGVNTSKTYKRPSGALKAFDIEMRKLTDACDLGGQPDSIAVAPDVSFLAVAIENERDEDRNNGLIPQLPAGNLTLIGLKEGVPDCSDMLRADLTGLAKVAPSDPEPEYVSINALGETVVTLQENNHLAVVARDGRILSHFSARSIDLDSIDTTDKPGALRFTESQPGRKREPDAVVWIDDDHFATANEGDYEGGSRGWTIFSKFGEIVYESGPSFEQAIAQIGHYPDKRSDAKGVEPESITFARYDDTPYVFVGAERASVIGVYDVSDLASPVLTQLLPSGIGPEGFVAIPGRNLLASANETDLIEDGGARAHVMLYEYSDAPAQYPHLTSEGADKLIGWGAISGMVADENGAIYAVSDGFYGDQPSIFVFDPSQAPARITDVIRVTRKGRPAKKLDLEGIALDREGGFWLASEGRTDRDIPHALYRVDRTGEIRQEIGLPPALLAVERRFGFEGIARIGDILWMAVQREWKDDPQHHVKLLAYNLVTGEWGAVHYPKTKPKTGWVGLSDITAHGDHVYIVERDNQNDTRAVTKKIYRVPLTELRPAPLGRNLPVVSKEEVRDLIPDLIATGGYVLDKVEGLAIMADGTAWVSTDNDGVDDHSGETMFFSFDID